MLLISLGVVVNRHLNIVDGTNICSERICHTKQTSSICTLFYIAHTNLSVLYVNRLHHCLIDVSYRWVLNSSCLAQLIWIHTFFKHVCICTYTHQYYIYMYTYMYLWRYIKCFKQVEFIRTHYSAFSGLSRSMWNARMAIAMYVTKSKTPRVLKEILFEFWEFYL